MKILKRNHRDPRVSLVLLDWSVRESFHLLHYLGNQTVNRDAFEVIVIEYHDTFSEPLRRFENQVDTWVLLQMPRSCYYHKHLMYNAGLVLSRGEIVLFGDSDAMVRSTFIESIISNFHRDPMIVYHLDEFRNVRQDYYPFNYPEFDAVIGEGCINNRGGKTTGILDESDPIHSRNYGACMCARKQDLISIGGADEDMTYLGHICGPYDMTFRLMNYGRRLVWDQNEYLYHTWHPGTDGTDNYLGPHDGRNMSSTSFEALCTGRIKPLVENKAVQRLRLGLDPISHEVRPALLDALIDPEYCQTFERSRLGLKPGPPASRPITRAKPGRPIYATHKGCDFYDGDGVFYAVPTGVDFEALKRNGRLDTDPRVITGDSFSAIVRDLDRFEARLVEVADHCNICAVGDRFAVVPHDAGEVDFRFPRSRDNPHIVWAESLTEARTKASRFGSDSTAEAVCVGTSASPGATRFLAIQNHMSGQTLQELMCRLDRVDMAVRAIYESRIWRTLVAAGRMAERVGKILHLTR